MKFIIIFIPFLFLRLISYGQDKFHQYDNFYQNGSGISTSIISEQNIKKLDLLGKVWGFLKYFHPDIRKGRFNWDYELLHIIPNICNTPNSKLDSVFIYWIKQFDFPIPKEKRAIPTFSNVKVKPNLKWIAYSGFGEELKNLLLSIAYSNQNNNSFYVYFDEVPKPQFLNENPYSNFKYPDVGFRILALFRYWNIIKYYYPYRYLLDRYWDNSLFSQLKKFTSSSNELEYKLNVLELITSINDSHATIVEGGEIIELYKGNNYAPIELSFIENKAVVVKYYDLILGKKSGLLKGDIVISINNISIQNLIQNKLAITPASNYPTKLREIARELLRTKDDSITLQILRDKKKMAFKLKCYPAYPGYYFNINYKYNRSDTCFKVLEDGIGYVNPFLIKQTDIPKIMKEVLKTKGFIMDFRFPPSENISSIGDYLMTEVPFAKLTRGSIEHPGSFE